MAKVWNNETNKPEEVSGEIAANYLASGKYRPVKGEVYGVVDPDSGEVAGAPAESAMDFINAGWRVETEAERSARIDKKDYGESALNTVQALSEGITRGVLPFGLGDALLTAAGSNPEALSKRKKYNPLASASGEVYGVLASTLYGGAASKAGSIGKASGLAGKAKEALSIPYRVSKGADKITDFVANANALKALAAKGVVGKAAAKAVSMGLGSAAEGAFYGASQLVNESVLGEADITAENLASYMSTGALFGGAIGGGLAGAGTLLAGGVGKASKAYLDSGFHKKVKDYASTKGLKNVIGRRSSAIGQLKKFNTFDDAKNYANALQKEGLTELDDIAERVRLDKDAAQTALTDLRSKVDAAQDAIGSDKFVTAKKLKERFRADVFDEYQALKGDPNAASAVRKAEQMLNDMDQLADDAVLSFDELARRRRVASVAAKGGAETGTTRELQNQYKKLLQDLEESAMDDITSSFGEQLGVTADSYKAMKKRNGMLSTLEDVLEKRENAELAKVGGFGFQEIFSGIAGVANFGIEGSIAALAPKAIRETFDFAANQLASRYGTLFNLERAASAIGRAQRTAVTAAANSLTTVSGYTAGKIAQSRHRDSKKKPRVGYQKSYKFFAGDRAKGESIKEYRKRRVSSYLEKIKELQETAGNPEKLMRKLDKELRLISPVAPNISRELATTASRGANYILENIAKPPTPLSDLDVAADKWRPSDADIAKAERIHRAVNNHLVLLEDLEAGTLTKDTVDAVKAVHPRNYQKMVADVIEAVADKGEALSYAAKQQLATLTGTPMDSTQTPKFSVILQQVRGGAPTEAATQGQSQGGVIRGPGADKLTMANDYMGEMTRISSRRGMS